ncbi:MULTISPECIES: hypothetical protein [unclassified Flavobacterium]|uniref:hypothetical protein n=1 Tax=unclassified Flavobacterium TaxID=196869 RepID=UPI001F1461E2|nr:MULTISPECIES: hypothetical protein [unclassified Flavobacterium]UMY64682.1 hypothetical protein MKO97_09170 [Flavobacterium sp. HJ-32-4]
MEITKLNTPEHPFSDAKLNKTYTQFGELLDELGQRELPETIISALNASVDKINASTLEGNQLCRFIKQQQTSLLRKIEKELKLVPRNHYRNMWMMLGMTTFGLPIGAAIGVSIGNIGLLGIGLPFGMGIGIVMGSAMDKKALKEGRQLGIE